MRKSSQQVLLLDHDAQPGGGGMSAEAGSESYSSNSSFTDSYSNGSDLANWEEYVQPDGTLFFAEYMPHTIAAAANVNAVGGGAIAHEKRIEFTRSSSLRMGKKPRRQQQQKPSNSAQQHQQQQQQQQQEFRLAHIQAHENFKQLELVITASDRFRFGRRSTAVESILGFRVIPFLDQPECLMVDSFVHDMPTLQQSDVASVKRGDWFKSLDDIEVRTGNVDELLLQFTQPTKVTLKFQGLTDVNIEGAVGTVGTGISGEGIQLQKVPSYSHFADILEKHSTALAQDEKSPSTQTANNDQLPFAMLIIPPECYQLDEHKDSMFYYPEDKQHNFLYKARGSFLTLNAVLTEELQTKPLLSKLLVEGVQYFVSYRAINGFLVLYAFCAQYQTMKEASLRSDELINYMHFSFPTLSLEDFANFNTTSTVLRNFLHNFSRIQRVRVLSAYKKQQCLFEELLRESRYMPLPKEAQLRIFDALSEMEAMDYRNWNDEPLNTHREFFIHGSILYYDHFMLASQLPVEARANVEGFLRCRGIFDFIAEQSVKELYVWEEIMLPNAAGRYFLTICSRSHLIMAVILKIFDAPDLPPQSIVPPSLFYIEEIQETLDHLIQCGIESLAMFWSLSNKRPEVLEKIDPLDNDAAALSGGTDKDSRKLETFLKQKLISSSAASGFQASQASGSRGMTSEEEAHLCSSLGGSSIHSLTPSEDDSSKKQRSSANTGEESDSGSDWEGFTEQNPLHYGDSEGQAQMTESLWKEINNVVPANVSPGWKNSIYYYIYVDSSNGTVFCPTKVNNEHFPYMREMRMACHSIHDVLQSTKAFRRQISQESAAAKGVNNTSASTSSSTSSAAPSNKVAIKEYGMTVVVREKPKEDGALGAVKGRFTVVGRLFFSPAREVYICHRPDVPQNMVEIAFRLSFYTVG